MSLIKVVVHGALGKMGRQVLDSLCAEEDMSPVAACDSLAETDVFVISETTSVPLSRSITDVLLNAQVVVDFTNAEGAARVIREAASSGVNVVVGSTGLTDKLIEEAGQLAEEHHVGIVIAPNFAVGAALLTHLANQAAPFFDYADLTETHHEAKIDAPSGTAISLVNSIIDGKGGEFIAPVAKHETVPGTRGGVQGGVTIHSARLPGRIAHPELIFAADGQTLTLRHDSINRESFMPGVMMAIRHTINEVGLTVGLDKVMGL